MRQHRKPQPRNGHYYGMRIVNVHEGETWLEGEEFCYSSPDGQAMNRRAYVRFDDGKLRIVWCCIPDTYFTIPAVAKISGKRIKGFISSDSDQSELKFTPTN